MQAPRLTYRRRLSLISSYVCNELRGCTSVRLVSASVPRPWIVHTGATASRAPVALRHDGMNLMAFRLVGGSELSVGSRGVGRGRGAQLFQPRHAMAVAQIEPRRPV